MLEGPTRVGGVPTPRGRAGHPCGCLVCCLTSTLSLLVGICSKKIAPEGFIPFGLRLIRDTKIGKKNSNSDWASG